MKKIIISASFLMALISTQLTAESNMYIGVDAVGGTNTTTVDSDITSSVDKDDNLKGLKVKLGTTRDNGWRFQIYYLLESYDDMWSEVLHEIGYDVIKSFEITNDFAPFIQVGIGYGWTDKSNYSSKSVQEMNAKIGAGLIYKLTTKIDLIAGADYKYRKWEDVKVGDNKYKIFENGFKYYAGLNFHF